MNNSSTDNCAVTSLSVSPTNFTCINVGGNTATPAGGPLDGETVVITRTLASMSRDAARGAARAAGATVTDSVSRRTTLLVAGAEPGSKLRRAQELGVTVVGEDEFKRRLVEPRQT